MTDSRMARHAPATARNREPILAVLQEVLPPQGLLLELAAGTGEHAVFFATAFPELKWQPSDPDPTARASIAAHTAEAALSNLRPPIDLNVEEPAWEAQVTATPDAILAINLIHIAPWEATLGLMRGAGKLLHAGGPLLLYGPYRRQDKPTAPSNEAFDESLRARDPRWGLRLLEEVVAIAAEQELDLEKVVEMPANNLTVVFRRQ
ncbi:MAG TPA: DUF938 domain-containing protein [Kiloniellales bacterium]|nr:DUF938 domain-containing protein [Kiloniellales bacterium]